MPTSTSDPRRTRRTVLLVPALAVVLAVAGYLAHPSLRLTGSEAAGRLPGAGSASALSGEVPAAAAPPADALMVGTAVDALASPEAVAAALYDAYAAAVQVIPASCHLPGQPAGRGGAGGVGGTGRRRRRPGRPGRRGHGHGEVAVRRRPRSRPAG